MNLNLLNRLTVARKMMFAFGVVCLLCSVLGAVSIASISRIYHSTTDIDSHWLPAVNELSQMRISLGDSRRQEFNTIVCKDNACLQRFILLRQSQLAEMLASQKRYQATAAANGEQDLSDEIDRTVAVYLPKSEHMMQLAEAGKIDEATLELRNSSGPAYDSVARAVEKNLIYNRQGAESATAQAEIVHKRVITFTLALIFVILAVSVLIGRLLTVSICQPLRLASELLERVADKDLTQTITLDTRDELGQMAISLNSTIGSISGVLGTVTSSADSLSEATENLTENAAQSSKNAQTLSNQVQQVAASSQEMTATIDEISGNAERAAEASRASVHGAEQGGRVMDETSETMSRISSSNTAICEKITVLGERSKQIGNVITVIRDIAEQTNLLALNAAIESARAGEHGRGFAVVSGEVRRLAERASHSAQEIATMIESIQKEMVDVTVMVEGGRTDVEHGIERMTEARSAINAIVSLAQKSGDMVTMIATAAHEQSAASGEISRNISNIANIATETASSSDQTALACKQLEKLADGLNVLVSEFRLAGNKNLR